MKLSKKCYAVTGLYYQIPWSVNAGFIVGSDKTLIIDSGSNYISAQTIHGYAETTRPDNEIILINTEKHLDHIGGNGFFSERLMHIYGHALINRNQAELTNSILEMNELITNSVRHNHNEAFVPFADTIIFNPDIKFDQEIEIDLGDTTIQVLFTMGHTDTNISVYCEQEKILYAGDCIINGLIPNLENGNASDWSIWLASLDKIKSLDLDIIVPGHGNIISGKENITNEINRIKNIISHAIDNNMAPTAENVSLKQLL